MGWMLLLLPRRSKQLKPFLIPWWGSDLLYLDTEGALGKPGQNGFISGMAVMHGMDKAMNFLHKNSCSHTFTERQLECKQLIVKVG